MANRGTKQSSQAELLCRQTHEEVQKTDKDAEQAKCVSG